MMLVVILPFVPPLSLDVHHVFPALSPQRPFSSNPARSKPQWNATVFSFKKDWENMASWLIIPTSMHLSTCIHPTHSMNVSKKRMFLLYVRYVYNLNHIQSNRSYFLSATNGWIRIGLFWRTKCKISFTKSQHSKWQLYLRDLRWNHASLQHSKNTELL